MDNFRFLSHSIGKTVPSYGNEGVQIAVNQIKSIDRGDLCNTYYLGIENHLGTHVDSPYHFFSDGKRIADYPAASWIFNHPFVLERKIKENEIIGLKDMGTLPKEEVDIVLIKTGFQSFRGTRKYSCNNPGVDPELGFWLRKEHPSVKALGFDFVSLSSYQDRELGRSAHRAFLDPKGENHPILIIEDMDLSADLTGLKQVFALPLRIEEVDSAPCTVVGVFN